MLNEFSRTELIFGTDAMEKLRRSRIAVFGVGGVGGFTVEALVRSGVGEIDIFDDDKVCLTNLNRQIIATTKTIGQYKVDIMKTRGEEINPTVKINANKTFYMPENSHQFDFSQYDYIIDAIDTVTAKIELIVKANDAGTPIISAMGAGNKLDPTQFEVTDIYKTSVCPLARVMRYELKRRNIKKLKVVYSKEKPHSPSDNISQLCKEENAPTPDRSGNKKNSVPGSTAFVPSVMGLIIAGEVIKDITGIR